MRRRIARSEQGDSHSVVILAALITAAATIIGAFIATRGGDGEPDTQRPPRGDTGVDVAPRTDVEPSLFLSRDSGPAGASVKVSGEGFDPQQRVTITFQTYQIGTTTTNSQGKFSNVAVEIPKIFSRFAPQQFYVVAQGGARSAMAPFTVSG